VLGFVLGLVFVVVACGETPEPVVPAGPAALPCSSQKECPSGNCLMDPCIIAPCTAGHCQQ